MLGNCHKDDLEMTYWRKTCASPDALGRASERYNGVIKIWGIDGNVGSVLEIGPGALGGVLGFLQADRKVGIDPLFERFRDEDLLSLPSDVEAWTGCIEGGELRVAEEYERATSLAMETFDTVVTINALDHGDGDFRSLSPIASLLKPGGIFYLHVHLRTLGQLNPGHDHQLRLTDYEEWSTRAGFKELWRKMFDYDDLVALEGGPPSPMITLVAKLEKI